MYLRTATVSTTGWAIIPKDLREQYGLKKGTQVQVVDRGNALHDILEEGPPLTADLPAERAQERAREESRGERGPRRR